MAEKISLLLDGQLPAGEVAGALDDLGAQARLRDRFTLYGLVGDALRGLSVPDDGFSRRIVERLRREGVQMEAGYDPLGGRD